MPTAFCSRVKAGAGLTRHPFMRETSRQDAFTYAEMMMALAILALVAASTFAAMSQANRFAITNRVYTCAQTLVQNQIDTFLSVGPFYPQFDPALVPTELAAGTTTTNNVPIYADTATAATVVLSSMVYALCLSLFTNVHPLF